MQERENAVEAIRHNGKSLPNTKDLALSVGSQSERVIALLNARSDLPSIYRFLIMAKIYRAAKLGDVHAQRLVQLCEVNVN